MCALVCMTNSLYCSLQTQMISKRAIESKESEKERKKAKLTKMKLTDKMPRTLTENVERGIN